MTTSLPQDTLALLKRLGVSDAAYAQAGLSARSPITGETVGTLRETTPAEADAAIGRAQAAYLAWRKIPAPRRGEFVRLLGEELRAAKADLGLLVTLEAGKVTSEGLGEVQEMIDICDFAVGLSRQLYGLTIATERPNHRMMETWHPIGVVGVISAFNFPVAVWCWNAALAFVCGDSVVWKPSEKTPLTALAVQAIVEKAMKRFGPEAPAGLSEVLIGAREIGDILVQDHRVPVVSATGSTRMGREVGQKLAARFARAILELGGNNAAIVAPSADLDIALRGIAFAAMGTAGQRCTTLRRLIVHESVYDQLVPKLAKVYASVKIGDPREAGVLVGPLVDEAAYQGMQKALSEAKAEGGTVHGGDKVDVGSGGFYVRPALVEMPRQCGPVERETFAPILYVMKYKTLDEAIAMQNAVGAGLSSSIFTLNMREAEVFVSDEGSDCGIANVNIGPSGAEIGGAFGGEKETGGGREAGSDAWKAYMRRATNTLNYGTTLPLAQGVSFDVDA
ncbi:aldehyde dehydrogenase family protein [Bosea sp. (in: a-proteobacteria)]|uniref:L-piperidine-6-carboxylate dehydrogenase n=1 Tax=Bosea sp. (in: a-proteobacteria) TaxID=1871050 RepID=UPI0012263E08|nr:aldehyde dehydrogenase family protein [Bosea sp. (in: a-proteobacteria)]TAJ27764.1 MAG: aldehyde dehydrogenase family protein [Bosea sp. (in: a-proteobacteria)]